MAPKVKDNAWAHCDVVDGKMICKFCEKSIGGGGILRLKQRLAWIRGQVKPCDTPNEVLGHVKAEYLSKFEKFEETKAREKAIQNEIARKRELIEAMKESGYDDYEIQYSTYIPSTNDPFHYVPPLGQKSKATKRPNIQSYFSSTANPIATSSQPSRQPTLDQHWKKQCKETYYQNIIRWWYDVDIPFNVARSPYYQVMWDSVIVAGKGFKGPSVHDLMGALLQKEISSIDEYLAEYRASWLKTCCSIM